MVTTGFNFTRRDTESIWCTSNNMNGLQLVRFTLWDQRSSCNADQDGTQIGLDYSSGPLMVGVNQASYNDYSNDGWLLDTRGCWSELQMTTFVVLMTWVWYDQSGKWTIEQTGITGYYTGTANGLR